MSRGMELLLFYVLSETQKIMDFENFRRLPLFGFICHGIEFHLLKHGEKAVAAGGGEMLLKADVLHEMQVGGEDFLWCVVGEHADKERDESFHDKRIAFSTVDDMPFAIELGCKPDAALAAVDEVAFVLVFLVEGL